jgi:probable rRNA maturation factor
LTVYDIQIANEQSALELDEESLRRAAIAVLESERIASATISIAIVTDELIHMLNRRHLDHDYPTDVLSFLLNSEGLEGEVIVSTDTAIRESIERGVSAHEELKLYLVHGLLHLCGYDDHSDDDRQLMRQREQAVLSQFGIVPVYD